MTAEQDAAEAQELIKTRKAIKTMDKAGKDILGLPLPANGSPRMHHPEWAEVPWRHRDSTGKLIPTDRDKMILHSYPKPGSEEDKKVAATWHKAHPLGAGGWMASKVPELGDSQGGSTFTRRQHANLILPEHANWHHSGVSKYDHGTSGVHPPWVTDTENGGRWHSKMKGVHWKAFGLIAHHPWAKNFHVHKGRNGFLFREYDNPLVMSLPESKFVKHPKKSPVKAPLVQELGESEEDEEDVTIPGETRAHYLKRHHITEHLPFHRPHAPWLNGETPEVDEQHHTKPVTPAKVPVRVRKKFKIRDPYQNKWAKGGALHQPAKPH
jgi:hypothetical protein